MLPVTVTVTSSPVGQEIEDMTRLECKTIVASEMWAMRVTVEFNEFRKFTNFTCGVLGVLIARRNSAAGIKAELGQHSLNPTIHDRNRRPSERKTPSPITTTDKFEDEQEASRVPIGESGSTRGRGRCFNVPKAAEIGLLLFDPAGRRSKVSPNEDHPGDATRLGEAASRLRKRRADQSRSG